MGAAVYERSGLLDDSRLIIERYLLTTGDLKFRLNWLSLCERLGHTSAIVNWLASVEVIQKGAPRELMTLALAIDRYLGDPKCLSLAYRALREAYDDPQIHLGYTVGLFFNGRAAQTALQTTERIDLDTAVVLTEKTGSRRLTRVIETEPKPRIALDEIGPDDSLALRLIGLRIGDEVELDTLAEGPSLYVVTSIQSKFMHAHFRSLERFQQMFPESRAFGALTIDDSKGPEQFKPLFDLVKGRSEFTQQIMDVYRAGRFPLAFAARLGGSTGFEFWEAVHNDRKTQFSVTMGTVEDYRRANEILKGNRRAIIDPITLFGSVRLGIADSIKNCCEDLAVVQTTIDLLRSIVTSREQGRSVKQGWMAWDGENYQLVELGPEAVEQRISEANAALSFATKLTVIPAEAEERISEDAAKLFGEIDPAYLDSVLAAKGDSRILLCDDLPFRLLATEMTGVLGVWSQAAIIAGAELGLISNEDQLRTSNRLVEAGYFYTAINTGNILYELVATGWTVNATIRALIAVLARPANTPEPVLRTVSELIWMGWGACPNTSSFITIFTEIIRSFRSTMTESSVMNIVNVAMNIALVTLRSRLVTGLLRRVLRQSTSMTSIEAVMSTINTISEAILGEVRRSIREAVVRSRDNGSGMVPQGSDVERGVTE